MDPKLTGTKYDKIAAWWDERYRDGEYGLAHIERALAYRQSSGNALDVGCGAGGRVVRALQARGYQVTGLDVSAEMLRLASANHSDGTFIHADVSCWESSSKFDFIVAWDSIFHLPYEQQEPVVSKFCRLLRVNGVVIYSFGNANGEHTDNWHGETFHYSSIGISENLRLLIKHGLTVMHLELDQYPENHAYVIAKKV